jgi:hypothetical protein
MLQRQFSPLSRRKIDHQDILASYDKWSKVSKCSLEAGPTEITASSSVSIVVCALPRRNIYGTIA